jgi:hypothetical protein
VARRLLLRSEIAAMSLTGHVKFSAGANPGPQAQEGARRGHHALHRPTLGPIIRTCPFAAGVLALLLNDERGEVEPNPLASHNNCESVAYQSILQTEQHGWNALVAIRSAVMLPNSASIAVPR